MKKRVVILVTLVALLMALSGCGLLSLFDDPIVGTWNMTSETYLGYTFTAADLGVTFTLTAKSDKSISMSSTDSYGTTTDTGTWSKSGSTYTLTGNSSGTATATISGTTMTMSSGGASIIFKKK